MTCTARPTQPDLIDSRYGCGQSQDCQDPGPNCLDPENGHLTTPFHRVWTVLANTTSHSCLWAPSSLSPLLTQTMVRMRVAKFWLCIFASRASPSASDLLLTS